MPENLLLKNGILAYNERRYADAQKYFRKILAETETAKDPETVRLRDQAVWLMGLTATRLGDFNAAIDHFRRLIRNRLDRPTAVRLRLILGYIYALKKDYPLSRDILQSAIRLDPENVQALAALAFVHYRLKEYKKAVRLLKQALKLDADNPNAHNSLGFIYAETGEKLDEAVKECEKALSLKPDYPAYKDSLGVAYLKTGRIEEAKRLLSEALEQLPEHPEVREHFRELVLKELELRRKDRTD